MEEEVKTEIELKKFGRPVEYTEEKIKEIADGLIAFMEKPDNFWMKDYAHSLGISHQRLAEQAHKNAYLSAALEKAKELQEAKLAKNGLKGKFNAQMTKFALTNVAGWREAGTMDVTSGGQPLGYVQMPAIDVEPEEAQLIDESETGSINGEIPA